MNGIKILAIALIVGGVLGLLYGSFSYTKETHHANKGQGDGEHSRLGRRGSDRGRRRASVLFEQKKLANPPATGRSSAALPGTHEQAELHDLCNMWARNIRWGKYPMVLYLPVP